MLSNVMMFANSTMLSGMQNQKLKKARLDGFSTFNHGSSAGALRSSSLGGLQVDTFTRIGGHIPFPR
ncbi:MAG: hypothetical protein KTR14_06430 [Vampirovibrio sp.]|nr:hypothetical protein [Vampirovibrio sp.]